MGLTTRGPRQEKPSVEPDGERADEYLEVQLAGPRLTQITFGTGPDDSPMPDPGGKGVNFVNGNSSGSLTAYDVQSRKSTNIVSEDATNPSISPDGKRLMYIAFPVRDRTELWCQHRRKKK